MPAIINRKSGYFLAFGILLIYIVLSLSGFHSTSGWFLVLFFIILALSVKAAPKLSSFTFTAMIFAALSVAMYYPQWFVCWGDFKLSELIIPLLQIIMFGMGSELQLKDLALVIKMPKAIIVGVVCHYVVMSLIGFALANLFDFPKEKVAGIILVGCCPSGLASNVMSYLAKANLALSITVTSSI